MSSQSPRLSSANTNRRTTAQLLLITILFCSVVFAVRARQFALEEPRIDQAAGARLLQEVRLSPHFLPQRQPGESFRDALEADSSSALHHIAKFFYVTPHFLFISVFFIADYLTSFLLGFSYKSFVIVSIAFSTFPIAIVAFWAKDLLGMFDEDSKAYTPLLAGALGLVITAASFYPHFFSPWGTHNFGVAALVVAGFVTSKSLRRLTQGVHPIRRKEISTVLGFHLLAFYTHWTNLLLLPPATVLSLLVLHDVPCRQKLKLILGYSGFVILCATPVVLVMAILHGTPGGPSALVYAGFSTASAIPGIFQRALAWAQAAGSHFSIFGLIAALFGLAVAGRTQGAWFPLALVASHFLIWTAMPGFSWNGSATELRTYNYLIPFLSLGVVITMSLPLTTFFRRAAKLRFLAILMIIVLVVLHLGSQASVYRNPASLLRRMPKFYEAYLRGQGNLRIMVRGMDRNLPSGASLLTWNYPLQDFYYVLSDRRQVKILPALDALSSRENRPAAGDLRDYIRRRRFTINCEQIFLAASDSVKAVDLQRATYYVLGPAGFACGNDFGMDEVERWATEVDGLNDVSLYRVRVAK